MPSIQPVAENHVEPGSRRWNETAHIGLSSADGPIHSAAFLVRNPRISFVAVEDGPLVGACLCGHDGRRGYIRHLSVAGSHRRSRLDCGLREKPLNALPEAGVQKCHAIVFHANPDDELFWEPQGWERRDDLVGSSMHSR